ncbi:hypothetical protein IFM89_004518 [Coptis chinensis]|uniref:Uncharacterized protein n=1 Tax=Coptis chinensis TaxID=261450 RepID=A0A835GU92_9MAGN|nr:hypothetical protein IFM89_004518 [Coptis chinensis]
MIFFFLSIEKIMGFIDIWCVYVLLIVILGLIDIMLHMGLVNGMTSNYATERVMALSASAIPSISYRMKSFAGQNYPVHRYSFSGLCNHQTSLRCSKKIVVMGQFSKPRSLIMYVTNFRDKLWDVFPQPLKELPWKKAENMIVQRLLVVGEKTLMWSLAMLFIFSSLSDAMLSIYLNKELLIPLGLFVGCVMTNFFKEVSQDLFQSRNEGELKWHLLGISFIFVFAKVASSFVTVGGQVFLSHVGNGGLMQVLWFWKKMRKESESNEMEKSSMLQETSITGNLEH